MFNFQTSVIKNIKLYITEFCTVCICMDIWYQYKLFKCNLSLK